MVSLMFLLGMIAAGVFWAALPVKLIALAGVVYTVVEIAKAVFPAVTGWKALALNIALSVAGALAVATPDQIKTPAFWAGLLMTVASASGIHGTVQAFKPTTPPS